jgi:hypothetical protein
MIGGVVWFSWTMNTIMNSISDLSIVLPFATLSAIGLIVVLMFIITLAGKYLMYRRRKSDW